MIIAYRAHGRAVLLYTFAKSERENIDHQELTELRTIGSNWLDASSENITDAIQHGILEEIDDAK